VRRKVMSDSNPPGHVRTRLPDDIEDPVEKMLERTGCSKQHYALQVTCLGRLKLKYISHHRHMANLRDTYEVIKCCHAYLHACVLSE
jgi:hypothetical protein